MKKLFSQLTLIFICLGMLAPVSSRANALPTIATFSTFNGSYSVRTSAGYVEAQISGSVLTAVALTPDRKNGQSFTATVSAAGKITGTNIQGQAIFGQFISLNLNVQGRRVSIVAKRVVAPASGFAPNTFDDQSASLFIFTLNGEDVEIEGGFETSPSEFGLLFLSSFDEGVGNYTYLKTGANTATLDLAYPDGYIISLQIFYTDEGEGFFTFTDNDGFYGSGEFGNFF